MRMHEYQKLALRTAKTNEECGRLRASNWSMGLAGEAGEAVDYVKKVVHHGHLIEKEVLIKELGDVLWYIAVLADEFDIDLGDIAAANIDKLRARYPEGFDSQRSVNRD